MTFFSCRLLTTPIFPRRLSSVLSKCSHNKINFRSGVTPWSVTRGGPPSDATPPRPPTAVVYARGTAFPRVPHNLTTGAMRSRNADFPMVVKSVTLHDIERRNGRQRASSLR